MAKSNCTHHFIIDSENVGRCKHCPEVRDFGKSLRREGVYVASGRRGAKARIEALKNRGRKKKEEQPWEKAYFLG